MSGRARVLTLLLCLNLGGCLVVPLGEREEVDSRANVGERVPSFVVPGKTTRADVLLTLGEPDFGPESPPLTYTYSRDFRASGFFFITGGMGGVIAGSRRTFIHDRLIFSFDGAGVVVRATHERTVCRENELGIDGQKSGNCKTPVIQQIPQPAK